MSSSTIIDTYWKSIVPGSRKLSREAAEPFGTWSWERKKKPLIPCKYSCCHDHRPNLARRVISYQLRITELAAHRVTLKVIYGHVDFPRLQQWCSAGFHFWSRQTGWEVHRRPTIHPRSEAPGHIYISDSIVFQTKTCIYCAVFVYLQKHDQHWRSTFSRCGTAPVLRSGWPLRFTSRRRRRPW